MLYALLHFPFHGLIKGTSENTSINDCGVLGFFSPQKLSSRFAVLKLEEKIFAHVCKAHFLSAEHILSFSSFIPPPFIFFFLKNHLHKNSCECTHAATDDGPDMIQWWCYEAILTVIQLDFAELQLRKWALKPEHVNICQPTDLLPIIPLYMLILSTNGAYSCLVSLRNLSLYSQIAFVWVIGSDIGGGWRTHSQEHTKHLRLCRIIDRMTSDQTSEYAV